MAAGNWTLENATEPECNGTEVDTTWLDAKLYPGQVVDRVVSPVWYVVGVTGESAGEIETETKRALVQALSNRPVLYSHEKRIKPSRTLMLYLSCTSALTLTTFPFPSHYLPPPQNSGPCNSFYCLGHFKNVYDDDDDRCRCKHCYAHTAGGH